MELNTFHQKIESGVFLISKPEPGDPRFALSVSLICEHDEQGSLGLILNRPTSLFLNPLTFQVGKESEESLHFPVFVGGPVQPEALFFLFEHDEAMPNTKEVLQGLYFGSSPETLRQLESKAPLSSYKIKFFLGYAGWSYFQLDCEFSNGSWFSHPGNSSHVFYDINQNLWLNLLKDMGPDFLKAGENFLKSF